MEPYWDLIKEIIRESDIVLEILDARSVEISRNEVIEKMVRNSGVPRIFVVNKIDLVNKKDLELSVEKLLRELENLKFGQREKERDDLVYVSNRRTKTIKVLLAKIRQMFSRFGKRRHFVENPLIARPFREAKGDIVVGVIGYPNVGKSSIINALCFKKKAKVSSKAGTTHGVHWLSAGKEIKLIDTPGVIPLAFVNESKLALISSRNPEKLKDPDVAAGLIIEQFVKMNRVSRLEEFYNIKIENKEDQFAIIEEIAKKKGHLRKGGLPDETRVSIDILRDWQRGKLKL
jgi:ribosome biogenesis GTPase A